MKELMWKLLPKQWRHAKSGYHRLQRWPDKYRAIVNSVPLRSRLPLLSMYSYQKPSGKVCFSVDATPHPLTFRHGTSDREVFEQVFVEQQYDIEGLGDVRCIVDAGANIGLASAFLLAKYPHAKLIAIEPDPDNLAIAKQNLQPFGDRCQLVHGAVWTESRPLTIQRRDEGHWATQVRESGEANDITVQGYTIADLCSEFNLPQIDLLKIDVEGAELPLFRDGDLSFLDRTRSCAVECHGEESESVFASACEAGGFQLQTQGELTIATKQSLVAAKS